MPLSVYSTLSRKKEPFPKQPGERVTMYVCGPTVYKPSHIGHMVGPVIFDTVKRYLTFLGYKVTWVINITDVDDKLIVRAKEQNTTVPALAAKMTQDYFDCLAKLNVTGVDHFPKATEHIDGMIAMMTTLIKNGHAYAAGGDVYFNVAADEDYGKLCNRDPEQLEAGARIEVSPHKKNPGDFAMWKAAKPGEPDDVQYDSPWGKGRPGWHIECSVMASKLLGETIDIHGGGLDLQFPHHENELAQSESATGKPFARVWMHNGLLRLGKGKMAGSVGNVWNIADALKVVSGDVLRFFILNTHYRSPIDMGDWDAATMPVPPNVDAAKAAFDKFVQFARRVERIAGTPFAELATLKNHAFAEPSHAEFDRRFREHMDDDFNTGGAVGVLFELVTAANKFADAQKLEEPTAPAPAKATFLEAARLVRTIAEILGLRLESTKIDLGGGSELVAGLMQLLIDLRGNLRAAAKEAAKDNPLKKGLFDQTDLIRSRLASLGVTLEDRPAGTTWRGG
jgi:cysteinyl-tRNA synthetase